MKRIGVRLPNPVGDVVAATPLLRLLRQRNPDGRIVAFGNSKACEVLEGIDSIDELEVLTPDCLSGWGASRRQAKRIKKLMLDSVYLLPNSFSSALAAARARIPKRIGRRTATRNFLLTEKLPPVGEPRAMTKIYTEMIGEPQEPRTELAISIRGQRMASETLEALAAHGICPPFLGVAPGAAFGPSKIYPPELMAEAVRLSANATGLQPIYFGAPSESDLIRRIKQLCPAPFMYSSIDEMKALLKVCQVLLTMDNGARHIAAALDIPQVVLFGATDPRWTNFQQELTVSLQRDDVECSPCHKKVCPIDHRCLTRITPEVVAKAVTDAARKGTILSF
ncbi:MAG: hypothetical protein COB96_00840 [Planctomycetota bacterium]|nr:MAG: hypothetical protein COB96_00840 [Planctomycetota bacterium]